MVRVSIYYSIVFVLYFTFFVDVVIVFSFMILLSSSLSSLLSTNKSANVPQQYLANRFLGIWVNKQRMEKRAKDAGKNSSMTDPKIKLLEGIGFVWAKEKGQAAWEEKFQQLQDYKQLHGNCKYCTMIRR